MRSFKVLAIAIMIVGMALNLRAQKLDSIKMGPGYGNDVYYSLATGEVKQEPNSNWHIAFSTDLRSSTILTNDGTGMVLYTFPRGDTASWDTMSIEGIETWTPMFNSHDDWWNGAFDRNALDHPDYGWGIYYQDPLAGHPIIGDSLFVIQLPDMSFKKLWIHRKHSFENYYKIQYANLDGSMDTTLMLDIKPYSSKNFAYFSFESHTLIDREPSESWDILFTRYFDERIPYLVTGVLSNMGIEVARIEKADTSSLGFESPEWSESRSAIGSDWKSFNMGTFVYDLADSLVFVIKDTSGVNHNLYFTEFAGSSTGKVSFVTRKEEYPTNISTVFQDNMIRAYPNPTSNELYIDTDFQGSGPVGIHIYNITGRMVYSRETKNSGSGQSIFINTESFNPGIYMLQLSQEGIKANAKIIIR